MRMAVVTVEEEAFSQIEEKGSKFISYLIPIDRLESKLKTLKQAHPKATHFVVAKRYLNVYDQIAEYSSDDGEPKGSSGVPVLNVMRGHDLIESAIIVVRYFGGTKLGVGGLVRAYTQAAKTVIAHATLKEYKKLFVFTFATPYNAQREARYHLQKLGISHVNIAYETDKIVWTIKCDEEKLASLKEAMGVA